MKRYELKWSKTPLSTTSVKLCNLVSCWLSILFFCFHGFYEKNYTGTTTFHIIVEFLFKPRKWYHKLFFETVLVDIVWVTYEKNSIRLSFKRIWRLVLYFFPNIKRILLLNHIYSIIPNHMKPHLLNSIMYVCN